MSTQVGATKTLFIDDFSTNGPIDATRWDFNQWSKGGSFYGNTQQRQELPSSSDGVLHLRLDTFNPTDPNGASFLGSEAITKQLFTQSGGGIAFEAKARYVQTQPGIMGGFFTFAGPADRHDEIDFEAISKDISTIQTNIYHSEPLGEGHPQSFPLNNGKQTEFHTYRIEWLPNSVRWLVDGELVRTEDKLVPTKAMAMHLNIWGPPSTWPTGDASLKAVGSASQNKTYYFDVDSVKVEQLSTLMGTKAADKLMGSTRNDWVDGGTGHDTVYGGDGNDVVSGGTGHDTLNGQAGDDTLRGRNDNDVLRGGAGRDSLYGGAGIDRLVGGTGADQLWGGAGADRFIFTSVKDSTVDEFGRDSIGDFSRKQGDLIDLSRIDANSRRAGDQTFSFIGKLDFHHKAGELRYENADGHTSVSGDVNGDGVADFSVDMIGVHAISKAYFIL